MSLFAGAPPAKRKFLFWWVCIEVRFLLALSFFFAIYYGPRTLSLASALVLLFISVSFLLQRFYLDNKVNIWWNRVAHSFLYFIASIFALVAYTSENRDWGVGTASTLAIDLFYGMMKAYHHTWDVSASDFTELL